MKGSKRVVLASLGVLLVFAALMGLKLLDADSSSHDRTAEPERPSAGQSTALFPDVVAEAPFPVKMPTWFPVEMKPQWGDVHTPPKHLDIPIPPSVTLRYSSGESFIEFEQVEERRNLVSERYELIGLSLPSGVPATYLDNEAAKILTWYDGRFTYTITVGGPLYAEVTREDLVKIAASVM